LIHSDQDLLNTDADIIVQYYTPYVANDGLSEEIKNRYPIVEQRIMETLKKIDIEVISGHVQMIKVKPTKYVAVIYGDFCNNRYINYNALAIGLLKIQTKICVTDLSITISCYLNDEYDEIVKLMIIGAFAELNNEIYICR